MKQVLQELEALTRQFSKLTYFELLEGPGTRTDVDIMARGLSFFVLSFQDALRLNAEKISDPTLCRIAAAQRKDDAGHDLWFLNDLRRLGVEPDVGWLFGKAHQRTRDTSYEIISELYAAPDDYSRLVVALVLEATGGVYFSRVYKFFSRLGLEEGLQFFARSHWEAEQGHDVFALDVQAELLDISLSEASRRHALATAARVFESIAAMCNHLSDRMLKARARQGFGLQRGDALASTASTRAQPALEGPSESGGGRASSR